MTSNQSIQGLRDLEQSLLIAKWNANDLIGHTGYFIRKLLDTERSYVRNVRMRVQDNDEHGNLPNIFWKSLNDLTDFLITLYRHDYIKRGVLDNCLKSIGVFAEATETEMKPLARMAG